MRVIECLQAAGAQIGYGMLACSLAIARLSNPGEDLTKEKEIKFIQDLGEFVAAYWTEGEAS